MYAAVPVQLAAGLIPSLAVPAQHVAVLARHVAVLARHVFVLARFVLLTITVTLTPFKSF